MLEHDRATVDVTSVRVQIDEISRFHQLLLMPQSFQSFLSSHSFSAVSPQTCGAVEHYLPIGWTGKVVGMSAIFLQYPDGL